MESSGGWVFAGIAMNGRSHGFVSTRCSLRSSSRNLFTSASTLEKSWLEKSFCSSCAISSALRGWSSKRQMVLPEPLNVYTESRSPTPPRTGTTMVSSAMVRETTVSLRTYVTGMFNQEFDAAEMTKIGYLYGNPDSFALNLTISYYFETVINEKLEEAAI